MLMITDNKILYFCQNIFIFNLLYRFSVKTKQPILISLTGSKINESFSGIIRSINGIFENSFYSQRCPYRKCK